jgi:predicted flap endonuclease-1-like 5' DNA nuclease
MEEPQSAAQTVDELDELELQEIDERTELATGEFLRENVLPGAGRSTVPPPLPPEARARRSTPPPGALPAVPPPAGASVPPPLPRAGGSGMYRIDDIRHTPTLPGVAPAAAASDPAALRQRVAELSAELSVLRAQHDRLRLTLRLREDRIREIERVAREHEARCAALEAELAAQKTQTPPDDLKRIPGIGPGFERALHALGVTTFSQIAAWSAGDVERIAREIRTVPTRIERGCWIEHARALAEGAAPAGD